MDLVGLIGYRIAAAAFSLFFLLVIVARLKTLGGTLIATYSLLSVITAVLAAFQLEFLFSLNYVFYLEYLKLITCSLLLIATNKNLTSIKQLFSELRVKQYLGAWGLAVTLLLWEQNYPQTSATYTFQVFLVFDLVVLVILEQLYRNADVNTKWALWPMTLAFGAMVVFDFVMFSQASLVNRLDFNFWYIRGFILTLTMPLLLISTKRLKNWSVNVFVSRNVVFYSTMLIICGGYLLLMAVAGYMLKFIGGHWGTFFSIGFLALGIIVLIALLLTERLRREVKVFITKHFFANKYDYRVEWLKMIDSLDKGNNESFHQTAVQIICSTLQVKQGALVRVSDKQLLQIAYQTGLNANAVLRELKEIITFCQAKEWIIDINEYRIIENAYGDLELNTETFLQNNISIIIPLYSDKKLRGFFLTPAPGDGKYLNWEDRDLLFSISKQLSHYISLHEAQIALAESKQFDAFNRMSAFLVHDLKNIQAQLQLINANAKRHLNNPEFIQDAFETVQDASNRLNKVLQQLRDQRVTAPKSILVDVNMVLKRVVKNRNIDLPSITLELGESAKITLDDEKFSSVINHLLQNAQEATTNSGWVKLQTHITNNKLHIDISDNGCGMSKEFIENRLFKPFDTTKGNAGMGIGVYETKQYIESLEGTLRANSQENEGTNFHIALPIK